MMHALKAMDNIWWVGALDPNLRVFDIIMRSEYGTTYNAYLVRGANKTALIETVKHSFWNECAERIRSVCDPSEIDYLIVDHTEPDHVGSVASLLQVAPNATVVGTKTAIQFLSQIVNGPFSSMVVGEGDELDLGGLTLRFLWVPMLHWPDTMYTYIPERAALFTCDSFGCHYSDERVFNDLIEGDFYDAYKYYFDNIIGPYKHPHMTNALKKIEGLDIQFIGNGHGPVLRANIPYYIDLYKNWCAPTVNATKSVAVAYVSAYGYTEQLAREIVAGLHAGGVDEVRLFDLVTDDNQAAADAVLASDGFLLGSPTIVGDALPPVYGLLNGFNPVIHRGRPAGAFGSYGWSGEAVPNLIGEMTRRRLSVPLPGFKVNFKPNEQDLRNAYEFGRAFAGVVLAQK